MNKIITLTVDAGPDCEPHLFQVLHTILQNIGQHECGGPKLKIRIEGLEPEEKDENFVMALARLRTRHE